MDIPLIGQKAQKIEKPCDRCNNYGYYNIGTDKKEELMQMFCACPIGKELQKLSIEWRMSDLIGYSDNILSRLNVIKARLNEPEKAGKFIDELKKDLEELVKKGKEAIKEAEK